MRTHKRHDHWVVVRQRESSLGQGSMMRHTFNGVVAARGVQMALTGRGAQGVAGVCSVGAGRNAIAGSRGHKAVPPSPKEMSSMPCPTLWTHVHRASTSAKWSVGQKCALLSCKGVAAGVAGVRKKYDVGIARESAKLPPPISLQRSPTVGSTPDLRPDQRSPVVTKRQKSHHQQ